MLLSRDYVGYMAKEIVKRLVEGEMIETAHAPELAQRVRATIEAGGDRLTDLHLWRLGPGHMGAILSVTTANRKEPEHYRRLLSRFAFLSHVTVEVEESWNL